jgi:hypothetical protein
MRTGKRKPLCVLRYLKSYPFSIEYDYDAISAKMFEMFGETVPVAVVKAYFDDKGTRRARPTRSRAPKSQELVVALQALWNELGGVCGSRDDPIVRDFVNNNGLSFEDLQQWFGQQRYKLKQRKVACRNVNADCNIFSDSGDPEGDVLPVRAASCSPLFVQQLRDWTLLEV